MDNIDSVIVELHRENKTGNLNQHKDQTQQLSGKESSHLELNLDVLPSIFENFQAGVTIIDAESSTIIYVNRKASEIIGLSKEQIRGHACHEFIYPSEIGQCHVLDSGKTLDTPKRMVVRVNGTERNILINTIPVTIRGHTYLIDNFIDIDTRCKDEDENRENQEKIIMHQNALLDLSKKNFTSFEHALQTIIEVTVKILEIDRCSFWRFNDDQSQITCVDLYIKDKNLHEKDAILRSSDYPRYFNELKEKRLIDASQAETDPRTNEFADTYLRPLGIKSMLDIPVRLQGNVIGILCNENCKQVRQWTKDEQNFGSAIADFLALQIEKFQRKKIEADLRRSKQEIENILNAAADGIRIVGKDFKIVNLNKTMERLSGVGREVLIGNHCSSMFTSKEYCNSEHCALLKVLESREGFSRESTWVSVDGRAITCLEVVTPYRDREGNIVGIIEDFRDITEIKDIEKKLHEEKENAKRYLDVAEVLIIALDATGHVQLINEKGCKILHASRDDVIGKHFFDEFFPQEIRSETQNRFYHLYSDDENSRENDFFEATIRDKQGNQRILSWKNARIRDETGRVVGILCSGEDITEKKKIEKAEAHANKILEERAKGFRVLYDTAVQVENISGNEIYQIISNNLIKICNAKKGLFFSIDSEQGIIKPEGISEKEGRNSFLNENTIKHHIPLSMEIISEVETFKIKRFQTIDECCSDVVMTSLLTMPYPSEQKVNLYRLASVRDKTVLGIAIVEIPENQLLRMEDLIDTYLNLCGMIIQRTADRLALIKSEEKYRTLSCQLEEKVKERTAEIEHLLKIKDEFIHQLSHDLKNPLTPLVNLIPLLEKDLQDEQSREILKIMKRNAGYMKNLVQKTLELALLNSDSTAFTFSELELQNEINAILEENCYSLEEHHISVDNKINGQIIVKGDKLRLKELIDNLLSNTMKYTNGVGTITFDAEQRDNFILVSMIDTGIGMTQDQIDQAFDEFFKADPSRHDFYSSGLGLPICKRIVEKHGGNIWIESQGLGKGTTVHFTLPIAK